MIRRFTMVVLAALLATLTLGTASAQEATPSAPLLKGVDLGLVDLAVEVRSDAFLASPDVSAGRVLVTVTNSTTENASQPFFLEMPDGKAMADIEASFAAITAMLQTGEVPADGSDPFAFLYQAHIAGGTSAPAGASRQVVVDLTPGAWVIADLDFIKPPVALKVAGELPASLPEVQTDATLTAIDTGDTFDFALDGAISAGPQIVAVVNDSSQPHFAEFTHFAPEYTVTEELFDQWIMVDLGMATPDPAAPMPPDEALTITGFAGLQSTGTTQWVVLDFEPGTYAVTCWVPDPRYQGMTHSAMGMYAIFPVA